MNDVHLDRTVFLLSILLIGSSFSYTLFTKSIDDSAKEKWVVIICCGSQDPSGKLRDMFTAGPYSIRQTAIHVYHTFKHLGYDDQHIYFLMDRNISCEGKDGVVSKEAIEYAITGWLANHSDERDDVCIVFLGHGHYKSLKYGKRAFLGVWNNESQRWERLFDEELNGWISKVRCNRCTIIIDACFSESFIKTLSKKDRIIIASTSPYSVSVVLYESPFSYFFFSKPSENVSYGEAWEYADQKLRNICEIPLDSNFGILERAILKLGIRVIQHPCIDDNGDGRGHGTIFADKLPIGGDRYLALSTYPS